MLSFNLLTFQRLTKKRLKAGRKEVRQFQIPQFQTFQICLVPNVTLFEVDNPYIQRCSSTWSNGKGGVQSTAPGNLKRTSSTQGSSRFVSLLFVPTLPLCRAFKVLSCKVKIWHFAIQVFEDNEVEQQPAARRGPKPKSLKEKEAKRKEKEVLQ